MLSVLGWEGQKGKTAAVGICSRRQKVLKKAWDDLSTQRALELLLHFRLIAIDQAETQSLSFRFKTIGRSFRVNLLLCEEHMRFPSPFLMLTSKQHQRHEIGFWSEQNSTQTSQSELSTRCLTGTDDRKYLKREGIKEGSSRGLHINSFGQHCSVMKLIHVPLSFRQH